MRIRATAGQVWLQVGSNEAGILAELSPDMAEGLAADLIRFADHARAQLPAASLAGLLARVGTHPGSA